MFEIVDNEVKLSVRELVEFIYRSGDLESGKSMISDFSAMQAGSRIHKKIQKSKGADYRAEVSLKREFARNGYTVILEGRADGILEKKEECIIDEIKGVYANVLRMEEPVIVHLMQAKCYAYIYLVENDFDKIGVTMTYANLDDETIQVFPYWYEKKELEIWMEETLQMLDKWVFMLLSDREKRNASICNLEFPFEYRKGQRNLVVSVYRTIERKKTLFIQAPTGVGKTMATLFPTIKAVGEGYGDKIFYLTAKTITRTVAKEAFSVLEEDGLFAKRIILTAKEKICKHIDENGMVKVACNPLECPYAKGYFERVNDAVYDMVKNEKDISREIIEQYAQKHMVCPFEMSLDATYWCDAIICDYNYVFDPNAYLRRFFADGGSGNYLFLIDEAHNLVERGREMYSASLVKEDLMAFKRLIKAYDAKLAALLEKCNKAMLEYKRQCNGEYTMLENASGILLHLSRVMEQMIRFSQTYRNFPEKEEYNKYFFQIRDFLNVGDLVDDKYVTYAKMMEDGSFAIHEYCVNPSTNLIRCMERGASSILFSATLLPIHYYRALLRDNREDYAIYAHSAFEDNHRCVLLASDVTTKYSNRGEVQYRRVCEYILGMIKQKAGNYMVFFPSYGYMESVLSYLPMDSKYRILVQNSKMSETDKDEFLQAFMQSKEGETLIGMCVTGGIFAEGIDLREDSLIGAIVVGTGLPMVCSPQEILKNYFDEHMGNGFLYSYVYPGFNRVLQAAGRVIRTAKDRGVILLLDSRFLDRQYDGMFPEEWSNMQVVNMDNFQEKIQNFWNQE